jgi:predicted nuclease of restriction endonuclease-like (RecB) superfamily
MEARMSKRPKKDSPRSLAKSPTALSPPQTGFDEVLHLIDASRTRAVAAVNTALIDLYWQIGEHISQRIAADGWGQGTVAQLADYIHHRQPNSRGFSASNLWRMMQFVETYRHQRKLATLLRELSWSHNLAIMSRCKRDEEREFYLRLAARERWSFRELQRQLNGALFERTVLSPVKLSTPLAELHPDAATVFKDSYLLEFLDLPPAPSEADLQRGLVEKLKQFLIELGRAFCFVGSQSPLLVIDGQQRPTTVTLLVEALARSLGDGEPLLPQNQEPDDWRHNVQSSFVAASYEDRFRRNAW